jgi:hypothetical protein
MKKLIIFLCVYLSAYTITNTKFYTKQIKPTILKADLKITITQKDLNNLIEVLNQNINKIKILCQKTTYTFKPVYKNETFETYKADIYAECSFKKDNIKNFSHLIKKLQNTKIKLTSLNYIISEKDKKNIINSLKTKAYNDILKEASLLSKKLNKKCFATNINLYTPFETKRLYATKSFSELPLPQENKTLSIKADYKIECY